MQKFLRTLMLAALLLPFASQAQETVTIGEGTSTTYVTPFNSLWGYSFVEQIYLASEIGTDGNITAVRFYLSSGTQTNNITLYMKNVTRSTFSSTSDYESVSASDIVYTGSVTFATGWVEIQLDQPFEYDGSSNLLVAMHEYTSGYSTLYFNYYRYFRFDRKSILLRNCRIDLFKFLKLLLYVYPWEECISLAQSFS